MNNKELIDLTNFKELWDEDGDMDLSKNLIQVFVYLKENKLLQNKKQKYLFLVSKILWSKDTPYRDVRERVGTIRKLKNNWCNNFGKEFTVEQLEELVEINKFDAEDWEVQARKSSTWGAYGAHVRYENERKEYRAVEKLPLEERKKEIERLNSRPNHLVIG